MKIGTFLCCLWGHKFVTKEVDEATKPGIKIVRRHLLAHCIRCGIRREELS